MDGTVVGVAIGSGATTITALGGFWFNQVRARDDRIASDARAKADRDAARDLANDAHAHERALAAERHEREAADRRAAKYYEERRTAYRAALLWALAETQRIQLRGLEGVPGAPPPPVELDEEKWAEMLTDVHLFGSREVRDAYEALRLKGFEFRTVSNEIATLEGDSEGSAHPGSSWAALKTAHARRIQIRREATEAYERLKQVMSDELASL